MSKGTRQLAVVRYVPHPNAPAGTCVYCGQPSAVRDHFYPRAAVSYWAGIFVSKHVRRLCFTVPACFECNSLIGSRIALTFEGRREYLRARLGYRYRNLLKSPRWSRAELSELRGMVLTHVTAMQAKRELVLVRLQYEHPQEIGPLDRPVMADTIPEGVEVEAA